MKARKISNSMKGYRASRNFQSRFFLSLMVLFAIAFVAWLFLDPAASAHICMPGLGGTTFASMMLIGNVNDVSDRQTHGSNIAYKVYLIELSQINDNVRFPKKNANREDSTIPRTIHAIL